MISSKEEDSLRFLQYVEDYGLRAYNRLISQNIVWNEKNWIKFQGKIDKKQKQEEAIKRGEEVITKGKHLRMGSMSMPAPVEHMSPHQHQPPCNPGFTVRSQSLHSVEGGEEEGSPTSRKQPPPKPRRDPSTKLSISSEAVDLSPTGSKGNDSERCDGTQGCIEDCRKVPPPKPKRNPNTQLSTSFDESYIHNHGSKGSPTMLFSSDVQAPSPAQPQGPQDSDLDEPVYIEMSGNVGRELMLRSEEDEPSEAVYEEMKYPGLDEFDLRWDISSCRSQCATPCTPELDIHAPLSRCTTPRGTPVCDIPAPFPNLLTHRPPLLVFPPVPAQCSPNSDESPLTPLDVAKLPMLENSSYGKSPTSSSLEPSGSASTPHLRRAERELTATPTITVSGRSSAPPLPCALYKSSSSSHGYQRSHSACPSPVSMGRCLTPLSLIRPAPFDGPFATTGFPRSASATPHGKGSPPQDAGSGGRHHGSMQNVSVARSRTPTSPLDELTNLFTTGRNMLKKNTSGRKSKEPREIEIKGKGHSSEYKREHKERSHHSKESKRDKDRSSNGKSLHRRDSKDREPNGTEALFRHDSKDCGYNNIEPLTRSDNKDRGYNCPELSRQESNDRGSSSEALPQRDSKDRGCNIAEPFARHDSKDRGCVGPEHLPRQDCKDLLRNGPDSRRNSRENVCYGIDLLSRHENKDPGRTGLERQRDKDGGKHVIESGKDKEKSNHSAESRRGSKERITNGNDVMSRWDCKDRGVHTNETLPRYDEKDKSNYSTESPKAQDKDARPGSSAMASSTWSGRSSMIPNIMLGNSNSGNFLAELKTLPKVGRSSSTTVAPSPKGTPQRQPADVQQMPPMPWLYSDNTMVEMIERKQRLCREIRSRERLPDHSPCKKESLPTMPSWKKTSGAKKHSPPPYPTQTTVFWDTAI
ncbi:neuronal tyrosine-phosphorylated phosphoinositide-3-kinase adapter 2 [Sinocyclocheilus rhinocerous]|uniref:neuronal tyrosine-phosphorylated phosphoinositide-3-kinase adapter 2 n=1 Tax=Sinocyclocheilus rhinocerous TaxID=307959 RepID=UPI0007BAB51D|nr:PREDICTED: neuronal tyrosine-phosphorylated phosphoinositide-3-kinase adapter 2-like [Sinocyclocheilus rhinocerous]